MNTVGFDFGSSRCVVAVAASQRGINAVLSDESKLETLAVVCFGDKQCVISTAGAESTVVSPYYSISQIKGLIGRQFSYPDLQKEFKLMPFDLDMIVGPNGYLLIKNQHMNGVTVDTLSRLFGMKLSDLKGIAQKNLNAAVVDCCIGIPVYFTDLQRRAVLDAATFAGLNPLRLIHETTATALAYGIYKTDLPENDQLNVAFIDIGHSSMQVCIAGFKKGQLKVLAHSYDTSLGGREFDKVLLHHFAAKIKDEYKIDVFESGNTYWRLCFACESLKRELSVNPDARLIIESFKNGTDVKGFINFDEFEKLTLPILERVKGPLEKALAEAGLTVKDIHTVEMVGSGCRVPAINKILTDFFKKEPRQSMNATECVAKGCALQCTILSPNHNIHEFQVIESIPFSISLSLKGSGLDAHDSGPYIHQLSTIVFPKGTPIPSSKAMTFYRSRTFHVDVQFGDASAVQPPAKISTYKIGPFQTMNGERAKVKLRVRLDLHRIVSVDSATLYGEEKVDIPVCRESTGENAAMIPVQAAAATLNSNTNIQGPVSNATDKVVQQMGEASTSQGVTKAADVEPVKILEAVTVENAEEDLLADLGDLDKAISISLVDGEKSNDLSASESIAASTTPSSSGYRIIRLVRKVQQLLNVQLELLATDEGLLKQFSGVLQQLDTVDKPETLTAQVTLLREFYSSLCAKFPNARNAISSHQRLENAQALNEKMLESYTNTETTLSASVTKGKTRVDQLSNEIQELELQLTEKEEKRHVIGIAVKKNESNLGKAVDKISQLLQFKGKLEGLLPASTKTAEDAKRLHNELGTQLSALKKSFDDFLP